MDNYKPNAFVFSAKYRVLRHVVFWLVHIIIFSFIWGGLDVSTRKQFLKLCLKGKYVQFTFIMLLWAVAGLYFNYVFRAFIFIPHAY